MSEVSGKILLELRLKDVQRMMGVEERTYQVKRHIMKRK